MLVNETDEVGNELGATLQCVIPALTHGINVAIPVPAAGNVLGNIVPSHGWPKLSVGATSTQAGTLSVQRFLDAAGTIKQDAAITASLSAGAGAVANIVDGLPFQSYQITISNSGGAPATLSNLIVLAQSN